MVFNDSDIGQFISDGYVVLRGAFSREVAEECRRFVWNQVPLWDECTTYGQPMVQIRKGFGCAPFDQVMNERLASGFDQLVGVNRWRAPQVYGWWSVPDQRTPDRSSSWVGNAVPLLRCRTG
jgi:hypothetical protein